MGFNFSDLSSELNTLLLNNPYYTGVDIDSYMKQKEICKKYQSYLDSYQENYIPTAEEINKINEIISKEIVFFQNDIIHYHKKELDFIVTIRIEKFGTYYIDKQNENYILYSDIENQITQYQSNNTYISNNEYSKEILEINLNSTTTLKINRNQEFIVTNNESIDVEGCKFSYHYYNNVSSLYGFAAKDNKTIYNYTRNYDKEKEKLVFLIKYKDNSIKLLHVENQEEYSITYSFYLYGAKIELFKNYNKNSEEISFNITINENICLKFLNKNEVSIMINEETSVIQINDISEHFYIHIIKDINNEYLIPLSKFLSPSIFVKIFDSIESSFLEMNKIIPNDNYILNKGPFGEISKKMFDFNTLLEKSPEDKFKNVLNKEVICYNNKNK